MFFAVQFRPPSVERKRSSWVPLPAVAANAYTTLSPGVPMPNVVRPAPENPVPVWVQVAPWSVESQREPLLPPSTAEASHPALVFARLQRARPPKEALADES